MCWSTERKEQELYHCPNIYRPLHMYLHRYWNLTWTQGLGNSDYVIFHKELFHDEHRLSNSGVGVLLSDYIVITCVIITLWSHKFTCNTNTTTIANSTMNMNLHCIVHSCSKIGSLIGPKRKFVFTVRHKM